jgi:hypothetical protein
VAGNDEETGASAAATAAGDGGSQQAQLAAANTGETDNTEVRIYRQLLLQFFYTARCVWHACVAVAACVCKCFTAVARLVLKLANWGVMAQERSAPTLLAIYNTVDRSLALSLSLFL